MKVIVIVIGLIFGLNSIIEKGVTYLRRRIYKEVRNSK